MLMALMLMALMLRSVTSKVPSKVPDKKFINPLILHSISCKVPGRFHFPGISTYCRELAKKLGKIKQRVITNLGNIALLCKDIK